MSPLKALVDRKAIRATVVIVLVAGLIASLPAGCHLAGAALDRLLPEPEQQQANAPAPVVDAGLGTVLLIELHTCREAVKPMQGHMSCPHLFHRAEAVGGLMVCRCDPDAVDDDVLDAARLEAAKRLDE